MFSHSDQSGLEFSSEWTEVWHRRQDLSGEETAGLLPASPRSRRGGPWWGSSPGPTSTLRPHSALCLLFTAPGVFQLWLQRDLPHHPHHHHHHNPQQLQHDLLSPSEETWRHVQGWTGNQHYLPGRETGKWLFDETDRAGWVIVLCKELFVVTGVILCNANTTTTTSIQVRAVTDLNNHNPTRTVDCFYHRLLLQDHLMSEICKHSHHSLCDLVIISVLHRLS